MKIVTRSLKWMAVAIACLLVALQFIRPARSNPAVAESQTVNAHLQISPQVSSILDRACADCHSNETRWPWYSNVAPVSWFVIDHVNHGRRHLNFSEWSRYSRRDAQGQLGSICKEVQSGSMPLRSYTRIHRDAQLSAADVKVLCDWADAEHVRLAQQ
jgi:Haem-binding domain